MIKKMYSFWSMLFRGISFSGMLFLFCLLLLSVASYSQPMQGKREQNFPQDYPVIHPQFRKWPTPALNNEVRSVSPALMWPAVKKAKSYDVRLSRDASFKDNTTIIQNNISYTIYNPHRALGQGKWYWQYRVKDDKWSASNIFNVPANADKVFAPPIEKLLKAIPASHPRTLIEKNELEKFRSQSAQSEDAKLILERAKALLKTEPPSEDEGVADFKGSNEAETSKIALEASKHASDKIYKAIDLFCKAFILTGNKEYATRGIKWALSVAKWNPDGVSVLSDFGDARCMLSMALAFDTFYDQLDQGQRKILIDAVTKRASRFYHDWLNNIDAKVLSNHVWQYILHYFFQASIAMYKEIPEVNSWLEYAYELWLARAPVLGGGDGGWCEGASYFRLNMETLLGIPTAIKQYTGYDFIAHTQWYSLNPNWILYSFPPASSADGFGDDIEKVRSPGKDYLAYADALAKLTGNPVASWYAEKIESTEKIKPSDADMLRWFRLRYLQNRKRPPAIDPSTLPNAKIFPGTGVADIHADISDRENDIMVSFRSSPYGSYGHLLADQNTFNVLCGGERLFYMSGHKVAMQDPHRLQWYKATQGHNGILIDDTGQPFNVEAYGYLSDFIDGKNISYIAGDASQAYSSKAEKTETGLKKFRRHLLFLHPDILLVYDELEADHPAKWSWLIHSPFQIKTDPKANSFSSKASRFSANAVLYSGQPLQWQLSDTFAVAAVNWLGREDEEGDLIEYKNDQWHLSASTTTKANKMRFLAVIKIDKSGNMIQLPATMNNGNELNTSGWTIHAEMSGDKPAFIEVTNNTRHVSFSSGSVILHLDGKEFGNNSDRGAKLAEKINNKYVFKQGAEMVPEAIKEIPR